MMFRAAIICGLLVVCLQTIRAEEISQADAVVRLLNLFAAREDPLAIANAGKLLTGGKSPTEIVASDLHKPMTSTGGWSSPETTRTLARNLGDYVEEHPDQFPLGLPDAGTIAAPLQLGPFFEGLHVISTGSSPRNRIKDLVKLEHLLDDSWLDAAGMCGAIQLQQLLIAHSGKLGELLSSYQESQDDVALIRLGETVANYPEALETITPGTVSARTLSLLLSGSFASVTIYEVFALAEIAAKWTEAHPDLPVMLKDLRDPTSMWYFEVYLLWNAGDHEAAVKRLVANPGRTPWFNTRFVMRYFPDDAISDPKAASLIRLLPDEVLAGFEKLSRPWNRSDRQVRIAELVAAEIDSRSHSKTSSQ